MKYTNVYIVSFGKYHISIMVKRCVVQFCSNLNKTGHTIHKFPRGSSVQVKRADFVEPTEHLVICNIHFSLDCHEKSFKVEMGLTKQSLLLSGAV